MNAKVGAHDRDFLVNSIVALLLYESNLVESHTRWVFAKLEVDLTLSGRGIYKVITVRILANFMTLIDTRYVELDV